MDGLEKISFVKEVLNQTQALYILWIQGLVYSVDRRYGVFFGYKSWCILLTVGLVYSLDTSPCVFSGQ